MTSNIQLSGKHNDGRIFVVGGNDFDDFYQNLLATFGGDTSLADAAVDDARGILSSAAAGAPSFQQAVQNVQAAFQPVQPAPPPQGPPAQQPSQGPSCVHGARIYKEGIAKVSQRPYKMWACPSTNRADQCAPEWVR